MDFLKDKKLVFGLILALVVAGVLLYLFQSGYFAKMQEAKRLEELKWRAGEEQKVSEIIARGDATKCDEVDYQSADGVDYTTVCQNNIVLNRAMGTLDPNQCSGVDGILLTRENCERRILEASVARDSSAELCARFSEPIQNECSGIYWQKTAILTGDEGECAAAPEGYQTLCRDAVRVDKFLKNQEGFNCESFEQGYHRNNCMLFESFISGERVPVCNFDDPRFQSECQERYK